MSLYSDDWQLDEYRKMAHDLLMAPMIPSIHGYMKEVIGYTYKIDPYNPWFALTERKLKVPFIARELLWYMKGDRKDSSIGEHAGVWKSVFEADVQAVSNYGHEVFLNQRLGHIVGLLQQEPSTRRAIIHFGHNAGVTSHENKKDQSCMTSMQFLLRDDRLHVVVNQRSQDYIYGVSGDAVFTTMVTNIVARFFEVPMAPIIQQVGSFHHYPKHEKMVSKLVDSPGYELEWRGASMSRRDAANLLLGKGEGPFKTWVHSLTL